MGLDGGITDKGWLDGSKKLAEEVWADKSGVQHRGAVGKITRMAAFDFCKGLGVGIVMVKVELAVACNKGAAVLPTRKLWNEEVRAGELYVDVEGFLDLMDCFKKPGWFGESLKIDIDGGFSPTMQNGCGPSHKKNSSRPANITPQRGAEGFHAGFIGQGSHEKVR
jgi:hypothetical protein